MSSTPITYQAKILWFDREWQMSNNGVLIPKVPGTWSGTTWWKPIDIISETLRGAIREWVERSTNTKTSLLRKREWDPHSPK
jgi:uncharacterized protein (DUF2461 family)